jgi:signal transduction histidine kinase
MIGRIAGRLRPRSYRARIAVSAVLVLAAVAGILLGLRAVVDQRVQSAVADDLQQQADAVAFAAERERAGGASAAASFLPDTSVLVKEGGVVIYWNNFSVKRLDARAVARRGDIEVILEREAGAGVLAGWLVPALVAAAFAVACVLIWIVSGRLAGRLRDSVADLSATAEAVAEGDLSARATPTEDELGRLASALNEMAARLEAAEARQKDFLADVAHELRTPVTAIEGFAAALADGTAASAEDRAEAAEFVRDEAARLRVLIRDLQELTWLDLEPPVRRVDIDLAELGRTSVARLASQAAAAGVTLIPPTGRAPCVTDPAHVETILSNLLTNAIRHTPAGGRITVRASSTEGEAVLEVEDTGQGIPAEHLPLLFERLYRVEPSRERVGEGGSGLGLSIVKRLATLLGGSVAVRSAEGEGSTFTVRLPSRTRGARERSRVPVGAER